MTGIQVVGGIYREWCREGPAGGCWDEICGSGLRAAASLRAWVDEVTLHAYVADGEREAALSTAAAFEIGLQGVTRSSTVSFIYDHALSTPHLLPQWHLVKKEAPFSVSGDTILRFGMVEGDPVVRGRRVVYDPQSPLSPALFAANGSTAEDLIVVANRQELTLMTGNPDVAAGAAELCRNGTHGVIVKLGPRGLLVVTDKSTTRLPAYYTDRVWPLGSGDVFSAAVAGEWGLRGSSLVDSADLASKAVATYVSSPRLLPPDLTAIRKGQFTPVQVAERSSTARVYLAGPFFTMSQRWLIDQARAALRQPGVGVFSPFHDVGVGDAHEVAPVDLKAIDESAAVLGLLDGLDAGTVFELGYARSRGIPVVVFVQNEPEEPMKMIVGSGCRVVNDFPTAIYHAIWTVLRAS